MYGGQNLLTRGLYLSEMSSWYVERLLLDRHSIRSRLFESSDRNVFADEKTSATTKDAFSDDTYLDLLDVESKIEDLVRKGLLNSTEIRVLKLILDGNSISDIVNITKMSNRMVSTTYKRVCGKIAFHLGDHFTNEGYISYMTEKYSLNDEQIEKLKEQLYSKIRLRK